MSFDEAIERVVEECGVQLSDNGNFLISDTNDVYARLVLAIVNNLKETYEK